MSFKEMLQNAHNVPKSSSSTQEKENKKYIQLIGNLERKHYNFNFSSGSNSSSSGL
jgi:hypothetical protein